MSIFERYQEEIRMLEKQLNCGEINVKEYDRLVRSLEREMREMEGNE